MLYICAMPITDLHAEGLFEFKKSPAPDKCCVKNCREEAGNKKKKVKDHWFCHRHWQTRYRWKNPKNDAYRRLKDHSKGRNLDFTITLDYFLGMMDCAAAWDREAESRGDIVTIDRINAALGYVPGNIRVISLSLNAAKGNRERHLPDVVQALLQRKRERFNEKFDDEYCPF